jgi:CrcB protein
LLLEFAMQWLAVGMGGALGSMARHWINLEIARRWGRPVPYATATVNLAGAIVIGFLAGLIATERVQMSPVLRTFAFVGILGGFTTFSSFMLDSFTLAHGGEQMPALVNLVGQTAVGMLLITASYYAAVALK